jgi:hypothetical protein
MLAVLKEALFYRERGLSVCPIKAGTKSPSVPWKDLQERHPTDDELIKWFAKTRHGIAIICGKVSGVIAVDCDSEEKTRELYGKLPRTEMMTRSSAGKGHLYYRINQVEIPTRIRIAGVLVDLKAEGSYCVAAPTVHPDTEEPYERRGSWNMDRVPEFDPSWIEEVIEERIERSVTRKEVKRVESYVMKIESVQGQGGSRGLVRAAAVCRDGGLTESEATVLLLQWNQSGKAIPPWDDQDIARAISRTYSKQPQ